MAESSSVPRPLFVTGYLRSGTSLVEKLLHAHPELCVGSQPAPLLYVALKEEFLQQSGRDPGDPYPLGTQFGPGARTVSAFRTFLEDHVVSAQTLSATLERLRRYDGWWTPELEASWHELREGRLIDIQGQLGALLGRLHGRPAARFSGGKEVFCEEYMPYFLDHAVAVVLVVRDVRDLLASMLFGRGEEFVGAAAPVLYVLRQWRKSVAFLFEHEERSGCVGLQYEELVRDQPAALGRVAAQLHIDPWQSDGLRDGLLDQHGKPWKGNSSFGSVRQRLPRECARFVETLCAPELVALGYPLSKEQPLTRGELLAFQDPVACRRSGFAPDYSRQPMHVDLELRRLEALRRAPGADEIEQLFIYSRAFERLRAADSTRTDRVR